jgi:hypothetical protein
MVQPNTRTLLWYNQIPELLHGTTKYQNTVMVYCTLQMDKICSSIVKKNHEELPICSLTNKSTYINRLQLFIEHFYDVNIFSLACFMIKCPRIKYTDCY